MIALTLLAAWIATGAIMTLLWVLALRSPHHNPRTQQDQRKSHDGREGLGSVDFHTPSSDIPGAK